MDKLGETARDWLDGGRPAVLVRVARTQGSAPRDEGTRMLVSADVIAGTVGGGHLELQAIAQARAMLASPADATHSVHYALGPSLGQCCGGAMTLEFECLNASHLASWPPSPARLHVQLFGAGHVGRAVARLLASLPVSVDWIDERDDEFPAALCEGAWPAHICKHAADALQGEAEGVVAAAPAGASFLVMTHRHDLDLRIVQAIFKRGDFKFLGLIGSRTKKQRFVHRLQERGFADSLIDRIVCPIGVAGIAGKEPEVIAVAAVAQLLQRG